MSSRKDPAKRALKRRAKLLKREAKGAELQRCAPLRWQAALLESHLATIREIADGEGPIDGDTADEMRKVLRETRVLQQLLKRAEEGHLKDERQPLSIAAARTEPESPPIDAEHTEPESPPIDAEQPG